MCIDFLRNKICKPKTNIEPPLLKDDITHGEVLTILRSEFGEKCGIYLSDINYRTCDIKEIERFMKLDDTDKYKYVPCFFDCDNYSFRLMGNLSVPGWSDLTFGIFWCGTPNGGHALNCFVDVERTVWIIEPQNNTVFRLPDDWTPWLVIV
jgi:hypothetical protein